MITDIATVLACLGIVAGYLAPGVFAALIGHVIWQKVTGR